MKNLMVLPLIFVLAVGISAQSRNVALQNGIDHFRSGEYDAALDEFKRAALQSPSNVPVQLWLGLAYSALDNENKAQDVWRAGIGDEKWEATVWALKGLAFWKQNQKNNAIYYFKQAQPSRPGYQIDRRLLEQISNDEDMPDISQWPQIVGLAQTGSSAASQSVKQQPQEELAPRDVRSTNSPAASKPRAGTWRGTVTNQKGNQTITFRVSPDGATISDITFVGYWRCPSAMNPTQSTRNAPPNDVAVANGSFSGTQNDKPSRMWYQFVGQFTSPTSASGTIRMAYAGGECDTYKLEWTAQRVGQ